MRKKNFVHLLLLVFLLNVFHCGAQSRKLDSLHLLLKNATADTSMFWYRNLIAEEYFNFNPDTSFKLWDKLEKELLANIEKQQHKEKQSYQRTLAEVKNSIGAYYYVTGNTKKAIDFWNESIAIRFVLKDEYGIALSYTNMGFFYYNSNDLAMAVDYWQKALAISDKINNITLQSSSLSCLGGVYSRLGEHKKSKEVYNKLLHIKQQNNDETDLESIYYNLASINNILNDKVTSLQYIKKAIYYSIKARSSEIEANTYQLLATIYERESKNDSAKYFFEKSYHLAKQGGFTRCLVTTCREFSDFLRNQKDYKQALVLAQESYALAQKINSPSEKKDASLSLSLAYEKNGDVKNALFYFKQFFFTTDSMVKANNEKEVLKKQLDFDHEREKLSLQKEQEKKDALEIEEKQKQKIILYSVIVVLLLAILLIIIVYRSFKVKKKANIELESKNTLIQKQKEIVEEHQKEILDSIHYAKRIQNTIIAHTDFVNENIPNNFILFNPKDIVSGDFYWASKQNEAFYFAICDSTGHGVPGAFMSLLNIGYLSEAINEKGVFAPNEVFNYVRRKLTIGMSKEGQKDGFDGTLLKITPSTNGLSIEYASANNKPILIRNHQIIELEANRMPVGYGERNESFNLFKLELKNSDTLYLFTDGYSDQFGGENGKKFMSKNLRELLASNAHLPLPKQKELLETTFSNWKGDLEQVDDVCVIGIKV